MLFTLYYLLLDYIGNSYHIRVIDIRSYAKDQVHSHQPSITPIHRESTTGSLHSRWMYKTYYHWWRIRSHRFYFWCCQVVEYSEKSGKSDYFGVISVIGGEESKNLWYSLPKTQNTLEIHTKTMKTQDFAKNFIQPKHFTCRLHENSGHSMRFFQKNGGNLQNLVYN